MIACVPRATRSWIWYCSAIIRRGLRLEDDGPLHRPGAHRTRRWTVRQTVTVIARAEQEGVAIAELIRRAVDAFLAWDDPTYTPQPKPQTRKASSSPA